MEVLNIISWCLGLIIYLIGGFVCGRICTEIIRNKKVDANEVLWFWAGFFFNVIAVFMTLCVKSTENKERTENKEKTEKSEKLKKQTEIDKK